MAQTWKTEGKSRGKAEELACPWVTIRRQRRGLEGGSGAYCSNVDNGKV